MCHGCSGGPADGGYRPLCESNESHPIPISETCPNAITNLPYTDPWNCNNADGWNNCEMYRSQICDGGPCQQAYHQLLGGADSVDGWCSPIQGCHDQLWGYPYICVLPSIGVVIVLICICACICVAVKKKMRARRAPPTSVAIAGNDFFLTHDWGRTTKRNNHQRVSTLNKALKERATGRGSTRGDGRSQQADAGGIDGSKIIIVFVTQRYMEKVNGDGERGDDGNCKFEFDTCLKKASRLYPVVMERAAATCRTDRRCRRKIGGAYATSRQRSLKARWTRSTSTSPRHDRSHAAGLSKGTSRYRATGAGCGLNERANT